MPIDVGQGVKVYLPPNYGRRDAVVLTVTDDDVISARIAQGGQIVTDLVYRRNAAEGCPGYWVELPVGYEPGSEGF